MPPTTEVAVPILDDIDSFAGAMEALAAAGVAVHVNNPVELVEDKDKLVGKPFLITAYRFNPDGDYGEFVSVMAITQDDERVVFNDGSSGIRLQLKELEQKGIYSAILCNHGLRRSDFRIYADTGQVAKRSDPNYAESVPAKPTYYLS